MSRREIRRMLTEAKKAEPVRSWVLPVSMIAVLALGVAIGALIGLLVGPSRQPPMEAPQATAPAEREIAPAPDLDRKTALLVPPPVAPPPGEGTEKPAWIRYAVRPPVVNGRPMVAVVIDDLGIDRPRTQKVLEMRAPLTLAFMTYAGDIERQTDAARARGHELMVHMPMQPMGEATDPGPEALMVGMAPEELRRRINWGLTRFNGFVGLNNHMGSRFTADAPGMAVVMEELNRRGMIFLDSLTTDKSQGYRQAERYGVPFATRQVFLDNQQDVGEIKAQLDKLELLARKHGAAIAIGHPHDTTIEALSAWLPTLDKRGLALVPVTTIVKLSRPNG